jgi:hypothetical protein
VTDDDVRELRAKLGDHVNGGMVALLGQIQAARYLWRSVDHEGEILEISAHALRQPDCGPGNNQQGANQSASAGGSEGGNDDESQEVSEEDPGDRTRYGNHAGPRG